MNRALLQSVLEHNVVIVLGCGGVGKTTSSIGIAVAAALTGKKVGLLSIDPARRLATALGIPLGRAPKRLDTIEFPAEGFLEAAMIDQKAMFDSMIAKFAPDEKTREKIYQHKLYMAASTKLAGPLEYLAIAQLQEMIESRRYDLIVLDTPPDTQALDFLVKPNVLSNFMENNIMLWLIKPFYFASRFGLGKLVSVGEKLMGGIAKVTGFQALASLAEFMILMQKVIEGFHMSGEKTKAILSNKNTYFLLVTRPEKQILESTCQLSSELLTLKFPLQGLIINQCIPNHLVDEFLSADIPASFQQEPIFDAFHKRAGQQKYLIQELIKRLQNQFKSSLHIEIIPETSEDIESIKEVKNFAAQFI